MLYEVEGMHYSYTLFLLYIVSSTVIFLQAVIGWGVHAYAARCRRSNTKEENGDIFANNATALTWAGAARQLLWEGQ